jgi:hypothetical protein
MESKPSKTFKFQATIQPGDGGGAYVVFPGDTQQEFATKGKVPINAIIGGVPYTGSLIRYGLPQHMLHVSKAIRQQTGKDIGDLIEVELWKDEEPRILETPADFKALMQQQGVLPFFESLSYTHRKEYIRWIAEAKTESTKSKRLTKAIEKLKQQVKTPG